MSLSQHELKELAALEKQFQSDSLLGPVLTRLRLRHPRATKRLGWTAVAVGSALVLLLLQLSVAASFGCFLIAVAGLLLAVDGSSFARHAGRLRSRMAPPDGDAK